MTHAHMLISRPGISVKDAQPKDLVFSSEYNYLKIKDILKGTITENPTNMPHTLDYTPLSIGWVKDGTQWYLMGYSDNTHISVVDADATNIAIRQNPLIGSSPYCVMSFFNEAQTPDYGAALFGGVHDIKFITLPDRITFKNHRIPDDIALQGFNYDYASPQIVRIYQCDFSLSAVPAGFAENTRVVPHLLGFPPAHLSFSHTDVGIAQGLRSVGSFLGIHRQLQVKVSVDADNLTIYGRLDNTDIGPSSLSAFTFYVFLFATSLE